LDNESGCHSSLTLTSSHTSLRSRRDEGFQRGLRQLLAEVAVVCGVDLRGRPVGS
jgi:hypothetical protein